MEVKLEVTDNTYVGCRDGNKEKKKKNLFYIYKYICYFYIYFYYLCLLILLKYTKMLLFQICLPYTTSAQN